MILVHKGAARAALPLRAALHSETSQCGLAEQERQIFICSGYFLVLMVERMVLTLYVDGVYI